MLQFLEFDTEYYSFLVDSFRNTVIKVNEDL